MGTFDAIALATQLSTALSSSDVTDLVIVGGDIDTIPALQRGIDEDDDESEEKGCVIGVASWTLGALYRACVSCLGSGDLDATVGTLVACPGHLRAWNTRKRALVRGDTNVLAELHFCALLLRRAPKAAEAWAHRRWLLRQCRSDDIAGELTVVRHAMRRAFANYYAGVHSMLVLQKCEPEMAVDAVCWGRRFLGTHPRDATAWAAYRVALLRAGRHVDVDKEAKFVRNMRQRYETSQSIKCHSKWWEDWSGKLRVIDSS